ncbi:histidine phosphatase family protein [Herbaspirillum sp. GCM10030257]|uniref:histidine phosphatase family protein n=1 Tax=Herbaspirillum sp. GCM10030257 TaxID=3273393 RepID=UPI00360A149E
MKIYFLALLAMSLAYNSHAADERTLGLGTIANQSSSAPQGEAALDSSNLVKELRRGGYIVYFRHTATDFSKLDGAMKSYEDCSNQRMLSDEGREAARSIGEHIQRLKLPVGSVLASPYCRTMETARLAFMRAEPKVEIRENNGDDYAGLKRLLSMPVPDNTNVWVVGHGTPFRAVAGPPHLAEGEAAVIRPSGTSWKVVARVPHDAWRTLPVPSEAK